jgi:hypothetical protein
MSNDYLGDNLKNRYSLVTRMSTPIQAFDKSTVEPFVDAPAAAPPPPTDVQKTAMADPRAPMPASTALAATNSEINQERFRTQAAAVSQEKNKFADSQLSLYAFLNIIGVGLIIYIAGATR